jgi:hypothetical protein
MGSSPVDASTQKSASAGAQGVAGTLSSTGTSLTGAGQKAQGALQTAISPMLNPSSMNVTSPTGAFATQYQNEKNITAQGANQALQSTNRSLASRGMGTTPAGFAAANTLQAYQNQADTNATNYANNAMASQNQAVNNFWNAASAEGNIGSTDINAGNQATQGAGSIYDSLYGTASQQKQNPILGTLGALGSLGSGVGGAMTGYSKLP